VDRRALTSRVVESTEWPRTTATKLERRTTRAVNVCLNQADHSLDKALHPLTAWRRLESQQREHRGSARGTPVPRAVLTMPCR
jgi:hypothetical protein